MEIDETSIGLPSAESLLNSRVIQLLFSSMEPSLQPVARTNIIAGKYIKAAQPPKQSVFCCPPANASQLKQRFAC